MGKRPTVVTESDSDERDDSEKPESKESLSERKRKYMTREEAEQWRDELKQEMQTASTRTSQGRGNRTRTPVQVIEVPTRIREVPPPETPERNQPHTDTPGAETPESNPSDPGPRRSAIHRRFLRTAAPKSGE